MLLKKKSPKPYHQPSAKAMFPKKTSHQPSLKAMLPTPIDKSSLIQYYKRPNIDLSTTQTQTLGILMKFKNLFRVIN
jgi:hypothetical protein